LSRLNSVMRCHQCGDAFKGAGSCADEAQRHAKTGTPQEFADFMAAENRRWAEIITAAAIKIE
jgi:hypothetical protein